MQSICNTYIFCKNVCLKDKIVFHNGCAADRVKIILQKGYLNRHSIVV